MDWRNVLRVFVTRLVALALFVWIGARVAAWRAETPELDPAELVLRAATGHAPGADASERERRAASDAERALLTDLDAASARLEARAPWTEGRFVPRLWGPEDRAALAADVAVASEALRDLERALARPACLAALECGEPFAPPIPKLGPLRNQVNLLCAAAILAARAGDRETARRRIDGARALPRLLGDGSTMSALIGQGMDAVVDAAERVLAAGEAYPTTER